MININTSRGKIGITTSYFAKLIGDAASSCYGVAGMVSKGSQRLFAIFRRTDAPSKGIVVRGTSDALFVELHIEVMYGLNINAIAKSIVHKVTYAVEDATGIHVEKVTVHIDGLKS